MELVGTLQNLVVRVVVVVFTTGVVARATAIVSDDITVVQRVCVAPTASRPSCVRGGLSNSYRRGG